MPVRRSKAAGGEAASVACGSGLGFFHFQQRGKGFFRADVPGFQKIQVPIAFDARGDGQEAIEATGVKTAVFVLGAAIHHSVPIEEQAPSMHLGRISGRDRGHAEL